MSHQIYTYKDQTFLPYEGEDEERLTGLFEDAPDEMTLADTLLSLHYNPEPFMLLGDCCSDCHLEIYCSKDDERAPAAYLALVIMDGTGMVVLLSRLPEVFALIREIGPAIDLAAKTAMLEKEDDDPGAAFSPNGHLTQAHIEPGLITREVIEKAERAISSGPLTALHSPMMLYGQPSRKSGDALAALEPPLMPPWVGDVLASATHPPEGSEMDKEEETPS